MARAGSYHLRFHQRSPVPPRGAVCRDVQAARRAGREKVFLPTGGATGASFVFDTTRSRFTDTGRLALQRLIPYLVQLRRNAHARKAYLALLDSTSAARTRLQRLTSRERVVLARAAAGETNMVIAQALFISPGTVRKHLEHIFDSSKSVPGRKQPRSTPKSESSGSAWPDSRYRVDARLALADLRISRAVVPDLAVILPDANRHAGRLICARICARDAAGHAETETQKA